MTETRAVDHISDTARWVAVYRARESARADRLFNDPFAALLAGAQGEHIVEELPGGNLAAWSIIVRTAVIDELVLRAVRDEGCDAVLNLAAGLDTRPYRLDLPPELSWTEVDLPDILAYKRAKLEAEGAKPRCRFERVTVDLLNGPARRELFARVARQSKKVFVLTEGFLMYLSAEEVSGLAEDFHAEPKFQWWLQDFVSQPMLRAFNLVWGGVLGRGNSKFRFFTPEGADFYKKRGWRTLEYRPLLWEAKRLGRDAPLGWIARAADRASPFHFARRSSGLLLLGPQ